MFFDRAQISPHPIGRLIRILWGGFFLAGCMACATDSVSVSNGTFSQSFSQSVDEAFRQTQERPPGVPLDARSPMRGQMHSNSARSPEGVGQASLEPLFISVRQKALRLENGMQGHPLQKEGRAQLRAFWERIDHLDQVARDHRLMKELAQGRVEIRLEAERLESRLRKNLLQAENELLEMKKKWLN